MEFLDEQGVQPCGHKAREKGKLIKVFTSCESNEIPTKYRYSVSGVLNDKNTGELSVNAFSQLLETQKAGNINSCFLRCDGKTINEPCTIQPEFTWERWRERDRIVLTHGKMADKPCWMYVLVNDDEDTKQKFIEKLTSGARGMNIAEYGRILYSGTGIAPPSQLSERMTRKYS